MQKPIHDPHPLIYRDANLDMRIMGLTGQGWLSIGAAILFPAVVGFPILLLWNLAVYLGLGRWFIFYPITYEYCAKAFGILLMAFLIIPAPLIPFILRKSAMEKLAQKQAEVRYLQQSLEEMRDGQKKTETGDAQA